MTHEEQIHYSDVIERHLIEINREVIRLVLDKAINTYTKGHFYICEIPEKEVEVACQYSSITSISSASYSIKYKNCMELTKVNKIMLECSSGDRDEILVRLSGLDKYYSTLPTIFINHLSFICNL